MKKLLPIMADKVMSMRRGKEREARGSKSGRLRNLAMPEEDIGFGHVLSSKGKGQRPQITEGKKVLSWDTGWEVNRERQNFKKTGEALRSQHKTEKRPDRFTLLTKTPKEILALEKGKFKTPPPMTTPVEKRNANKFYEFHGEVGHNTDECNHLRKQICRIMLKSVVKLAHNNRELKQKTGGKEQLRKKRKFSPDSEISFPVPGNDDGAEAPNNRSGGWRAPSAPLVVLTRGSSFEILYEHCLIYSVWKIETTNGPTTTSICWIQR
ncbi:hypothetical protein Tco_0523868 [Tanacetum coccineum]